MRERVMLRALAGPLALVTIFGAVVPTAVL